MSVENAYLAEGYFSIEQIEKLCLSLPDVTPEYIASTISESLQIIDLHYKKLPSEFIDLSEIRMQGIRLTGTFAAGLDLVPVFTEIANNAASRIGSSGSLELSGFFEEKQSTQTANGCDRVFIRNVGGRIFFCYSSNASKVDMDNDYRLAVFEQMVMHLDLPIKIEKSRGSFLLRHSENAELVARGTSTGSNPTGFFCELPNVEGEEAVQKMARFLSEFSSGKIFFYDWDLSKHTSQLDADISEDGKSLYDIAVNSKLPAKKYILHMSFHIQGLRGLENARKWCTQKDSLYSTVCYFSFGHNMAGNFVVLGSQKGYQIKLIFNQSVEIEEVDALFGIKFEEL